jgi:hypothetical protein
MHRDTVLTVPGVPTYDHAHKYRIAAWAMDLDGPVDTSRAQALRICVRDPDDLTPCL